MCCCCDGFFGIARPLAGLHFSTCTLRVGTLGPRLPKRNALMLSWDLPPVL